MIPVLDPSPIPNRSSFGLTGAEGIVSGTEWHAVKVSTRSTPVKPSHLFFSFLLKVECVVRTRESRVGATYHSQQIETTWPKLFPPLA